MKNIFKSLMLVAVAAMGFTACQKDSVNDVPEKPGFEVSVSATTVDTRSAFGDYNSTDKTYPTLWEGTEKWTVAVNDNFTEVTDITFSDDLKSANARFTLDKEPTASSEGTYTLFAVSPAARFVSVSMENDYLRYRIPASQTPSKTSCDAEAQVLIAHSEPTETPSSFDVTFNHAVAYAKFSFKNVADGGNVMGVTIKSEDVALAGRYVYSPSTKTISFKDEAVYEINLTTTSTTDLWVACGPAEVQGKTLTFTINTDKGKLSRPVSMPGNFEVGKVKTFTIDMAGIEYPVVENVVEWHKVTTLADITEGEYVIVDNDRVLPNAAVSDGPSNSVLLTSKATVGNNILTNVDNSVIWNFIGDNTAMKIQSYANNTLYLHNTNANDGVQVNTTSNKTWAFEVWKEGFGMKCNDRYLGSYESGSDWRSYKTVSATNYGTDGACITLYKKLSTDPTISANAIEVAATGGEGESSYTVKNMEDDVTATYADDWIIAEAGDGIILYEVEPNYTGAVRTGKITLTSESTAATKDVTVTQAADEFEVSATTVSLDAEANSTTTFTVTTTYAATIAVDDESKWSVSTANVNAGTTTITVTALAENAGAEAVDGAITVTRTVDNKELSVAISQKAQSTGGGEETYSVTSFLTELGLSGTTTLNADTEYNIGDDIKMTVNKGNGSNTPAVNKDDELRIYASGGNMTLSSEKTITKVVFTFTSSSYAKITTANTGTYDTSTYTWTGSATSITFTNENTSDQARIKTMTITYNN
ncbi:MAG: BACON domain-containing protein [Alistipes sp.]|nr:BACON domain-containing protein [Alistipes sp.]